MATDASPAMLTTAPASSSDGDKGLDQVVPEAPAC